MSRMYSDSRWAEEHGYTIYCMWCGRLGDTEVCSEQCYNSLVREGTTDEEDEEDD